MVHQRQGIRHSSSRCRQGGTHSACVFVAHSHQTAARREWHPLQTFIIMYVIHAHDGTCLPVSLMIAKYVGIGLRMQLWGVPFKPSIDQPPIADTVQSCPLVTARPGRSAQAYFTRRGWYVTHTLRQGSMQLALGTQAPISLGGQIDCRHTRSSCVSASRTGLVLK